MNIVKINSNNRAICPVCDSPGEYKAGGQTCPESEWVWENGNLIAIPARNWGGTRKGAGRRPANFKIPGLDLEVARWFGNLSEADRAEVVTAAHLSVEVKS